MVLSVEPVKVVGSGNTGMLVSVVNDGIAGSAIGGDTRLGALTGAVVWVALLVKKQGKLFKLRKVMIMR